MRLRINVTDDDISKGTPTPGFCPVAIAGNRALSAAGCRGWSVEFAPYALGVKPHGLDVCDADGELACNVPVDDCPLESRELAETFDEWWRYNPDADDQPPYAPERPLPLSFDVELPLPARGTAPEGGTS